MENDGKVLGHIERLVTEEHKLFSQQALSNEQEKRLKTIQVELDQCWDLLRQRRARREAGQSPEAAELRPPEVVERYQQ